MKKTIKFLGAAVLALAVVGCQNEPVDEPATPVTPDEPTIEEPAEFVLRATLPTSRTILHDDYSLSWSSSDQLAVFNAPTGTADYSANLHFVTKVDENQVAQPGMFVAGEGIDVPFEDGVNYDWYVLAPWRETNGAEEIKTPKGQSKEDGYFPIGAQTQIGYNNSVHVSSADLLVGKVTNTRTPNVALKHLAVLHKFTVTNNSNAATTTVLQTLTIVMVMVIDCFHRRRTPKWHESLSVLLALFGTFMLATGGNPAQMVLSPKGLFWGVMTAAAMTFYTIMGRPLMSKWSRSAIMGPAMLFGGAALTLGARSWTAYTPLPTAGWLLIAAIVVLGTVVSFSLFAQGIHDAGPVRSSILSVTEPVSAAVLAFLWLGTEFTPADLIGFAAILATVFLLAKQE